MKKSSGHIGKSDLELWQKFVDGDNSVLGEIYRRHSSLLFLQAYNKLKDEETAKDLVQEVFIKIASLPPEKRKNIKNAKAYLFGLLRRDCQTYLQRTRYRKRIPLNIEQPSAEGSFLEKSFYEKHLLVLIDELPPIHRDILLLTIQGYRNEEIGKRLGVSSQVIRKKKYEARKALKEKLSKEDACVPKTASPIELYFDLGEHHPEEISEIISYIEELYRELGGDEIIIERPGLLDLIDVLLPEDPVPAL